MFRSEDIKVFVFWAILWNFEYIFWTITLLCHQIWPIDRHKQVQKFIGISWTVWRARAEFQVFFNLATCSNYATANYVKIPVFHFL